RASTGNARRAPGPRHVACAAAARAGDGAGTRAAGGAHLRRCALAAARTEQGACRKESARDHPMKSSCRVHHRPRITFQDNFSGSLLMSRISSGGYNRHMLLRPYLLVVSAVVLVACGSDGNNPAGSTSGSGGGSGTTSTASGVSSGGASTGASTGNSS